MPCEWIKMPDGSVVHINRGRGGKQQRCGFCGEKYREGKVCDFPIGNGKTCDAEMCSKCATTVGRQHTEYAPGTGMVRLNDTVDLCPLHRDAASWSADEGIKRIPLEGKVS
jgi:hypothetical protein